MTFGWQPLPEPGDVFEIMLEGKGHEQQGRRPVIVVQDLAYARFSTRLCVPTSTSAQPTRDRVELQLGGETTVAMVEQLLAVSNDRLLAAPHVGRVALGDLLDIRAIAHRLIG